MKKENIIASGLGSRTNRALVGMGILLVSILNFSEVLGIPSEYVSYIGTGITVIGTITGYHFRNLTAKNANGAMNKTDIKNFIISLDEKNTLKIGVRKKR